jgi:hypothetical protein
MGGLPQMGFAQFIFPPLPPKMSLNYLGSVFFFFLVWNFVSDLSAHLNDSWDLEILLLVWLVVRALNRD